MNNWTGVQLMICGVLAVVFAVCRGLIWRWEHTEQTNYDERQMAAQGKAGKTAFVFLLIYLAVLMLLPFLGQELSADGYNTAICMGILLGGAVYATLAIWTDAYAGRMKWQAVVLVLLALGVLMLYDYLDGVVSMRGIFAWMEHWVRFAAGVVSFYLALILFAHKKFCGED